MLEQSELLDKLVDTVKGLVPIFEVTRQVKEGVTLDQAQRVRDYITSLVPGSVSQYWPSTVISFSADSTGRLDAQGR